MIKGLRVFIASLATLAASSSFAADGCTVALCLAGNWRDISQCIPPVRAALRSMLMGRFPTCAMASSNGTTAGTLGQQTCPPMYQEWGFVGEQQVWSYLGCTFSHVIYSRWNGEPWSDTFVDLNGNTSTRYYPQARAALGSMLDPRYDLDLQAFVATPAPTAPEPPPSTGGL